MQMSMSRKMKRILALLFAVTMKSTAAFLTAAAMTVGLFYSLPAWAEEPSQGKDTIAIYFLVSNDSAHRNPHM